MPLPTIMVPEHIPQWSHLSCHSSRPLTPRTWQKALLISAEPPEIGILRLASSSPSHSLTQAQHLFGCIGRQRTLPRPGPASIGPTCTYKMAKLMAPGGAAYEPHYTQDLYVPSSADAEYLGREITLYGRPVFEGISSTQVRHMPNGCRPSR